MQYVAVNLAHFKKNAVYKVGQEAVRCSDGYANNVDCTRTQQDYFASSGQPLENINHRELIEKELDKTTHIEIRKARGNHGGRPRKVRVYNDNGKAVRENANYMSGFIVTLRKETAENWGAEKTRAYFKDCADFFEERYGHKISDAVHMDEENPHLHYYFVPLDENGHLNTDKLFKKNDLKRLHTDLANYLKAKGYSVDRGGDMGKQNYINSMKQLKERTAKAADMKVCRMVEAIKAGNRITAIPKPAGVAALAAKAAGLDNLKSYQVSGDDAKLLRDAATLAADCKEKAAAAQQTIAKQQEKIRELQRDNKYLQDKYNGLVAEFGGFAEMDGVKYLVQNLREQVEQLKNSDSQQELKRLRAEVAENKDLLKENDRLKKTVDDQKQQLADTTKEKDALNGIVEFFERVAGKNESVRKAIEKRCETESVTLTLRKSDGGGGYWTFGKQRELQR